MTSDVGEVEITDRPLKGTPPPFPILEADLEPGTLVAVLCMVEPDAEQEEWMLATVVDFDQENQVYTVEDCEMEADGLTPQQTGQGNRRSIPPNKVLKLPDNDEEQEEFRVKSIVLALYPGTTCLYPATVLSTPSKRKKTKDYLLKFEDDEVPSRICLPRFIVNMK